MKAILVGVLILHFLADSLTAQWKELRTATEPLRNEEPETAYRPIGITILSVLITIIGTIVLLIGVILLVGSTLIATSEASIDIARNIGRIPGVPVPLQLIVPAKLLVLVASIFATIVGIIILLISWGLWTGVNLARWIAIIFFGLSAFSSLFDLVQGQIGSIVSLAINGLIVCYLFTPHVRRFFEATI